MIARRRNLNRLLPQALVAAVLVVGLGCFVVQRGHAAAVVGDINGDGTVNILDLSVMLSDWGTATAAADLNHDGLVGILDLSTLLLKQL